MQPVRGCIHFARVIRPSCDVRERVRDSCAEVTALQGRVILLIDHQEFWQNKFLDKFSWKRTISEGFLAGESRPLFPADLCLERDYKFCPARKTRFIGLGVISQGIVNNFTDFTFFHFDERSSWNDEVSFNKHTLEKRSTMRTFP